MARRFGIRWRSATAAAIAVALAAAAFAVALIATANSQRDSRELSQRLVPAVSAADDQLRLFTAQQTALRDAVTSGNLADLGPYRADWAAVAKLQAQLSSLARGDPPMTALANVTATAYQGWLASVADPQVAAMRRGDLAAARAMQADINHVGPPTQAVRTTGTALVSRITSEQKAVTDALNRVHNVLLGALIVLIVVVAAIAIDIIIAVWWTMLRPFGQLNAAVAAVADGDYRRPIPTVGPAELADLSAGVELMRTRLVSALAERERAEENARRLFELVPDAMVAVARNGTVTMANARAGQLFGYAAHKLVGGKAESLVPEESRADLAEQRARLLKRTRAWPARREIMATGLRRDGTTFPAEIRLSLLPTDHGTVVVAAVRDASERLAMAAEQERLRAAAQRDRLERRQRQSQRMESLGQLIGGVADDFDNLLDVISGYANLAAERLADLADRDPRVASAHADVREVQTATQQAITVTRQLLTFARSEPAAREVLNLSEAVENAEQLLRRSLGERIELNIAAEPDLWPVEADSGQLEQVLVNLAVNARDAMPGGGRLTIATANIELDAGDAEQQPRLHAGRYCRLAVADTGTGMDEATMERVFEPFFSTKPRGHGTGLGLATVYGIVSGLGGSIDLYSEQGVGTTVSVLLPVLQQEAEAGPADDLPVPDVHRQRHGHGEIILLVEDEENQPTQACQILTRNGYQVSEAADGADAVRRAQDPAQRVDLLVTDMVMPGMLGSEVVARVRAIRPRLPAVFITGYASQVTDFHGTRLPRPDVMQKPFTDADLLSHVRRALDRSLKRASLPKQAKPPAAETHTPFE